MPFTPAHAAIVLPFLRINPRYVSATGLIIGSVTPDFEYFFKMETDGQHGHTLLGLLYFDVPVALFLALVFHVIVKAKFIDNLPVPLQTRLRPLRTLDFIKYLRSNFAAFMISALAGAATHIFWDAFTHVNGFFVVRLPFYDGAYIPYDHVNYPLWYALQQIFSWLGMISIAWYLWLTKPVPGAVSKPFIGYWIFILVLSVFIVLIRFNFHPLDAKLGNLVVSIIAALCLSVLTAGMIPTRTSNYG